MSSALLSYVSCNDWRTTTGHAALSVTSIARSSENSASSEAHMLELVWVPHHVDGDDASVAMLERHGVDGSVVLV